MFNRNPLKKYYKIVEKINSFEDEISKKNQEQLIERTNEFKTKLNSLVEIYDKEKYLEEILPECFAMVREAGKRTLELRHYDVQLIGGKIIHEGDIAEMKTGEGKTLVITLSAYLNALMGKGVHVVTVNDYLAKRDKEQMGKIYEYLGLTVGLIQNEMMSEERKINYNCDITYVTNTEVGFDYLRDNMVRHESHKVLVKGMHYAIIDEVDSILIDEARTPLIISQLTEPAIGVYQEANRFVQTLKIEYKTDEDRISGLASNFMEKEEVNADVVVDRKEKQVMLTSQGAIKAEKFFNVENISDLENTNLMHHILIALKANFIFKRDTDYMIQDGKVEIIDEFTGRILKGRQYSEGVHQGIECKEGVEISYESRTLATITYQNLFKQYYKKSGMTGTAKTEEDEFREIYGMRVIPVPTNKPIARIDHDDVVFFSKKEKYNAIIEDIKENYNIGRPVLVGTPNVEVSEIISDLLDKAGVSHQVLNAKHHAKEAEIIAQAGQVGMITVATNMAGRGTDIVLSEESKKLGGLKVIGTERHEARRIDDQLRGRSGRQGDMGESVFYLSFEDDLLELFGGEKIKMFFQRFQREEGVPLTDGMLSKTIRTAQKKIEGMNYNARKHLMQYDDVISKQRDIIYKDRIKVVEGDILTIFYDLLEDFIKNLEKEYMSLQDDSIEFNSYMVEKIKELLNIQINLEGLEFSTSEEYITLLKHMIESQLERHDRNLIEHYIKQNFLYVVDECWIEYIDAIDEVKKGAGLQAYKQQDPVVSFIQETGDMFRVLIEDMQIKILKTILSTNYDIYFMQPEVSEFGEIVDFDALKTGMNQNEENNEEE